MATIPRLLLSACIALSVSGCGNKQAAPRPSDRNGARQMDLRGSWPQEPPATSRAQQAVQLEVLIDSLARLPGSFERTSLGTFSFRGDQSLFGSLHAYGQSAVTALVQCLDDSNAATATFQDSRVPIGYMCYTALKRIAYPTAHEDDTGDWPGILLSPRPTAEQLAAAKKAWDKVVRSGAYRIATLLLDGKGRLTSAVRRPGPSRSRPTA
jgi:hypothetical protein